MKVLKITYEYGKQVNVEIIDDIDSIKHIISDECDNDYVVDVDYGNSIVNVYICFYSYLKIISLYKNKRIDFEVINEIAKKHDEFYDFILNNQLEVLI